MSDFAILLVEDDVSTCKRFIEYIDSKDDVTLVSHTNSSSKALSDISYHCPDAVILDLELHHGSGSGLEVLAGLKDINYKPYVLVTTNNSSETTYEYVRQLGADFIMYKHQKDYSEKYAVDFLYTLKDIIKQNISQCKSDGFETPEYTEKKQKLRISKELDLVGISPKAVGYKYLIDAISIVMDGPVSNVCILIAEKHKVSTPSVERAMQNAINKTWKTSDIDTLEKYYTGKISSEKGSPTITEFIYFYANKIKNCI